MGTNLRVRPLLYNRLYGGSYWKKNRYHAGIIFVAYDDDVNKLHWAKSRR